MTWEVVGNCCCPTSCVCCPGDEIEIHVSSSGFINTTGQSCCDVWNGEWDLAGGTSPVLENACQYDQSVAKECHVYGGFGGDIRTSILAGPALTIYCDGVCIEFLGFCACGDPTGCDTDDCEPPNYKVYAYIQFFTLDGVGSTAQSFPYILCTPWECDGTMTFNCLCENCEETDCFQPATITVTCTTL